VINLLYPVMITMVMAIMKAMMLTMIIYNVKKEFSFTLWHDISVKK
jgi:hypothetical protein